MERQFLTSIVNLLIVQKCSLRVRNVIFIREHYLFIFAIMQILGESKIFVKLVNKLFSPLIIRILCFWKLENHFVK